MCLLIIFCHCFFPNLESHDNEPNFSIDGRMLPGSGPFSRLAMATGINHYIHYLKSGSKSFTRKGGVSFNVSNLVESMQISLSKIEKFY